MKYYLRHHESHIDKHGAFGSDKFGYFAEKTARFFGTPKYIISQTFAVICWLAINSYFLIHGFDPYPFILLNLMFSTQAAYAAPLILLAQTRQADRDKAHEEADAKHREELAMFQMKELEKNTELTLQILKLNEEIHLLTQTINKHTIS